MKMNQNNINMNNQMNIAIPNYEEILNNNEIQKNKILKSVNNKFDFFCCPKDKASILKEKFENFYRNFVYNFIHVDFNQTLEQN